ncbi:hypothetical protein QCA50_005805 [Cerrena zonata]|uniref:Uncharacterized protein n=1 Tax=Cerrena zonata TaxID=2478898 RepID=A0AAW0GM86_9APHY
MSRTYQSSVNGIKQEPFSWDQTFHDSVRKATIDWTRSDDHLIAFENYCKEKGHFNHIDWDDLRIRKFVKEEIDKNHRYLERCFYVSQWEETDESAP